MWQGYLNKLETEKQAAVQMVLEKVKRAEPEAEAAMPYGVPGYKYKGKNLLAVAAHKKHLGVYPFSPAIVKAIVPMLDAVDVDEGTVRFEYGVLPPTRLIEAMVQLRVKEIEIEK